MTTKKYRPTHNGKHDGRYLDNLLKHNSSKAYQRMLEEQNITGSMSRPAYPYDNACSKKIRVSEDRLRGNWADEDLSWAKDYLSKYGWSAPVLFYNFYIDQSLSEDFNTYRNSCVDFRDEFHSYFSDTEMRQAMLASKKVTPSNNRKFVYGVTTDYLYHGENYYNEDGLEFFIDFFLEKKSVEDPQVIKSWLIVKPVTKRKIHERFYYPIDTSLKSIKSDLKEYCKTLGKNIIASQK